MVEIQEAANLPPFLIQFTKHAITLEQIWQIQHTGEHVKIEAEIDLLINEKVVKTKVNVSPLDVSSLNEVATVPFEAGPQFCAFVEKLLADVDQAIRLLGGKPESKAWNQRDVLGILAEAKAYQTISAEMGKLSRRTKQKVLYHLKDDLGKAELGRPQALTKEEKASLLAEYDRSGLTQEEFVDLQGISRSKLTRLLRERRATK